MNLANQLTMARVVAIPAFIYTLSTGMHLWSLIIFLLASLTDFLDGYIARKFHMITNFGKLMDPLADKLLVLSALLLFIEKGMIPAWVVILIVSRELTISIFRAVAASEGVVIAAGRIGKGKTVVQMCLVIYILLDLTFTISASVVYSTLLYSATALTVISGVEYLYKNRSLLRTDK